MSFSDREVEKGTGSMYSITFQDHNKIIMKVWISVIMLSGLCSLDMI